MMRIAVIVYVLLCAFCAKSQESQTFYAKAIQAISSNDLEKNVYALASPKMEGRGFGTKGIEIAAEYISEIFKKEGIGFIPALNGYYQQVSSTIFRMEEPDVKIGSKQCIENIDYIGLPSTIVSNKTLDILVTKCTSPMDFQKTDIQGKTVLILTSNIFFAKKPLYDLLIKKGCRGVLICNPYNQKEFKSLCKISSAKKIKQIERYKRSFSGSVDKTDSLIKTLSFKKIYLSTLVVSPSVASTITGLDVKTLSQESKFSINDTFKVWNSLVSIDVKQGLNQEKDLSNNVLGFIEGSEYKDEVVVISAHYDHLGVEDGNILRGADDNASGTATVIEIAKAYSAAIKAGFKPKRSILFTAFTAEEVGLVGSRYFVNRVDSLKLKPIVDINIDMIGRGEDSLTLKKSTVKKVYIIAAKRDSILINKVRSVNIGRDSLNIDYSQVGGSSHMFSSDHANFYLAKIPAIMFFRGLHPDYHTMRDTPDKLDYEAMEKITKLIFNLSWKYVMCE